MEHLRCAVERVTFYNEENGYTVLRASAKGYSDPVTVVGNMPEPHPGAVLSLEGNWRNDAKYGRQFVAERCEETLPATAYGIEKYLGSGMIRGIGPKMAKRIVSHFGADTLEVIEETPERLTEVDGIGKTRAERIKASWAEQKEIKNIMLFLQGHGISTSHATKIYKTYGASSIDVVTENPYRLADDIWGIGFKTADKIAGQLGFGKDCEARLRSGLLYTMNRLADDGHCYAERAQLLDLAEKLLETEQDPLGNVLDGMLLSGDLVSEGEAIYLPPFYQAETGCARRLLELLASPRRISFAVPEAAGGVLSAPGIRYDEIQADAIRTALSSKVMVLTGGPGTGKTTTTLGIISAYRAAGCKVLLAAPTGRAAKRMTETSGMEAKTIHRLLEYSPAEGYQRNAENPLEGDALILDECSMIDILMMNSLLKAIPPGMSLVMVGDTDQLPSVGAGNVLKDIVASGRVPVVRLRRIFRQAQGSRIVMNAHRINRGEEPDLRGGADSDFFFVQRAGGEETAETVVRFCQKNLPEYYKADPLRDIQVLTPMQRGVCGAASLNQALQQALNPEGLCLARGGVQYRLRDKVMQIKNNYQKEVFNGDIGIITDVDREEMELTVEFDGRGVAYDVTELDELTLAYATTIHKAQGSEYPIVVMPFTMGHYVMLARNLLYTGVTRAKKVLVLVGERKAVTLAIRNGKAAERNTRLCERLQSPQAAGNEGTKEPEQALPPIGAALSRLGRSEFRSRFRLDEESREYVRAKGTETVRRHAGDIIRQRLAPAHPKNDGQQTPMRGHPVFIAQHATATCCRGCLEKFYGIERGRELTPREQCFACDVIMAWIGRQMGLPAGPAKTEDKGEGGPDGTGGEK